jgi:hypothetical protein
MQRTTLHDSVHVDLTEADVCAVYSNALLLHAAADTSLITTTDAA